MDIQLHSCEGASSIQVSDVAFGANFNETLVHQLVTAYLAGARSGCSVQKNRSAVRGGGAKPWRQKGTGRARAGTIRSPLWRGGGVTFASSQRDYTQKLNRKMYRAGMRSILSELVRRDRLLVVDDFQLSAPKTRDCVKALADLGVTDQRVLLVLAGIDGNVVLGARNLPLVDVLLVSDLNPVSLVGAEKVIVTRPALALIEERLG